jgi:prevent-host-death family protein
MNKSKKRLQHPRRTRRARPHKVWQLQEAKARFSELINEVERDGYHTITKNGRPVAMIISKNEFEKMSTPGNSLLEFFREAPLSEFDLDIERDKDLGRDIDL